jgi:hypothetical protein
MLCLRTKLYSCIEGILGKGLEKKCVNQISNEGLSVTIVVRSDIGRKTVTKRMKTNQSQNEVNVIATNYFENDLSTCFFISVMFVIITILPRSNANNI